MKYKPNWDDSRERWTALWEGRHLGRPCMTITAPSGSNYPEPRAATPEEYWLDPDYLARLAIARVENTHWGGEAIPSILLMGGWVICYGAIPHFEWNTIWHEPLTVDWDNPPTFELNWDDPWLKRYEAVYQASLDIAGWDDFMVGRPCILPANDILVAIISNDEFLPGLYEHPEWMRQAILTLSRCQTEVIKHFQAMAEKTHAFPQGNPQWMTFWAPEPYMSTQSDVSCMLSPAMFDEFIVPDLDEMGNAFGSMWYHLDGARARQHLPSLLSLPYMRVIQFIPEPDFPPNGEDWLELYKEIQAGGKAVHISVAPDRIEPLVRQLDPALLIIDTWAGSSAEADEMLLAAERWTKAGVN